MDKYIGKKVDGRYEIRELIGVGGMANVYKAYDSIEERIVAVKILREEFASNEEFLRRFKNESKAISVLNHPNIVKVYDVSFSDRMNSIVMEYIDGITLKEYIEHQKVLRYREAVHFTVQILRALQHAHDKGIVHRDIKPQNIMLLRDATIKITDFGIARFSRSETKTLTEKAIGSVHYISPEQASGSETDARTDIYSVGVILYEMLTGQVPFEADSPVSVAIKQIQSPLVRPREINPEIPEPLEEIILRATQKDVGRRYQSAAEMLRDIAEFKRNPTISFEYKYMQEPYPVSRKLGQEQETMRNTSSNTTAKQPPKQPSGKTSQPKAFPVLPVLAGISFAFALVAVLFIIMLFIINDPLAEVPDIIAPTLVGEEYEKVARNREYRDQVNIEVEETQFNSDYPAGVIFKQEPTGGKTIKQGATIRVKVSAGIQTVILPDYSGQEATEVYKKLREQGLDYDEFMIFSDTIADGYVVRTDPERKSEVQSGDLVTVYVSRGPQNRETRVPDVTGMNFDEAKALLASYKLRVSYVDQVKAPDEEEPGTVLEQVPEPDTQVREGSAVELTIVRGYLNYDGEEEDEEGGTSEKSTVRVEFLLPDDVDKTVKIGAYDGNKKIVDDELNPARTGSWVVNFKGTGKKEITLRIDNKVYAIYEVDFGKGTYRQV